MRALRATLVLAVTVCPFSLAFGQTERGFEPIFNGRDLDGWVVMGDSAGFKVVDGAIHSDGGAGGQVIQYHEEYGNYVLRLEWMLSTTGNSGVLVRYGGGNPWTEIQLMAPSTPPQDDLHCTGALYGYVPVDPRPDETPERWREMEIVCRYKRITVAVDGEVCCRADLGSIDALKSATLRGHIAFQDSHAGRGEWVKFRNIRVRDLDEEPDFVMQGLRSNDPVIRRSAEAAAVAIGGPMVAFLCDLMTEGRPLPVSTAEETLFAVAAEASLPGEPARREAVAQALLEQVKSAPSDRVRAYAARLVGIVGGEETIGGLSAALGDPATHDAALSALERTPGESATKALLRALGQVPAENQPGVIHALGGRRDPLALDRLIGIVEAPDGANRVAALEALGQIGGTRAANVLGHTAIEGEGDARKAAVSALIALADAQQQDDGPFARRYYRRALDHATTPAQRTAALIGLSETDPSNRVKWLFAGLAERQSSRTVHPLLAALSDDDLFGPLRRRLDQAEGAERAALLQLAHERGMPGAAEALLAAAEGDDEASRVPALKLLAEQPQVSHGSVLLDALEAESAAVRDAALPGCLAIAATLADGGQRDEAIEWYTKVLTSAPGSAAALVTAERLTALGVERDFATELGFVTHWWIVGTFPSLDDAAYEQAFFPESEIDLAKEYQEGDKALRWIPHHETKSPHGIVELLEIFPGGQNVACYAYAEVTSDADRDVLIKLGSDDGFVFWLNDERLTGSPTPRPVAPDQDVVRAKLKKGPNRLLLKILNRGSRWAYCLRVTDGDGKPLGLPSREAQ